LGELGNEDGRGRERLITARGVGDGLKILLQMPLSQGK
jgi:hypothetical protein